MPLPQIKSLYLHEAPALEASSECIRVAWIQPCGKLVFNDTLGPHYSNDDREKAKRRARSFLGLVKESDALIAIAPEYFAPIEALKDVIEDPTNLREGTLYILPSECLNLSTYEELRLFARDHGINLESTDLEQIEGRTFVNPCAIIFKGQHGLKMFLQSKIYESQAEFLKIARGENIFAIEGLQIVLVVVICSDANLPDYHTAWARAASYKPGAYIVHVQWNPHPDYVQHNNFRSAILNAANGQNRILFSLNWAAGSKLFYNGQEIRTIKRSRTRIFRGRKLQKSPNYLERSATGLHVSHVEQERYNQAWEAWHAMPLKEHAYFIEIPRPFENIPPPQDLHYHGVVNSKYFEPEPIETIDHFENRLPQELSKPFWGTCEEFGLSPEAHADINELPLSELERLINACLRRKNGSWMVKDVICRIPTASLLCGQHDCDGCVDQGLQCSHTREEWEDDAKYFVDCLIKFNSSQFPGEGLKVRPAERYPLNLIDHFGKEQGWLFHRKGLPSRMLEKELQGHLKGEGLVTFRGLLHLLIVGSGDNIEVKNIFSQPGDIDMKIGPEAISQDILASDHGPEIKVVTL